VKLGFSTVSDMKYSVILVSAVMTLAGAASAHLLTPSSQSSTSQLSTHGADAASPKVLLVYPPTNPGIQNSATVQRQVSVDVRRAPVPLQVRPRTPVALPTIDTSETYARAEAGATSVKDDKSNENAARVAIEADGYKGVAVLRKGDNGLWHAKAFRGKTEVLLTVDSRGTVTLAN
jgi:hypothetical protein